MGKKSKTKKGGKLYDDDPGCKYVVIENPWPDWGQAKKTNMKRYFDHIGAWLWYASNKTVLPLELYYVGTVRVSSRALNAFSPVRVTGSSHECLLTCCNVEGRGCY